MIEFENKLFYLIFREQRKRLGIHREILTNEKQGLKQSSPKFSRKDETISFSKYIFASFTYETILETLFFMVLTYSNSTEPSFL